MQMGFFYASSSAMTLLQLIAEPDVERIFEHRSTLNLRARI